MRKSIKKVAASLMAATMVLGTVSMAFAEDFTEDDVETTAHYTLAGGVGGVDWNPKEKANELKETKWDGIYSITGISFPAFDEGEEYKNRFKICKIDDVTVLGDGWTGSLCLGTDRYDDNQTMFRVETTEAVDDATVYLDTNTGAVAIIKDDEAVDYKFSWVGYEAEAGYTDIANFATCGIEWPSEKVKVDAPTDLEEKYNDLVAKVTASEEDETQASASGDETPAADAPKSNPITAADVESDVLYTATGNFGDFQWSPAEKSNLLTAVSGLDGVYSLKADLPADAQIKICKIDDITIENPWAASLCLGTDRYDDNQTQIYVGNTEEIKGATIYFDSNAGTVVILDAEGKNVDYKFRWVGFGEEGVLTSLEEFEAIDITSEENYPQDKVKVDKPANLAAAVKALFDKVTSPASENPTTANNATTTANNATTASNQSTKTGDVAPVAILSLLVAAVAVVTVAAKKREA